jgi:hypothetical protein
MKLGFLRNERGTITLAITVAVIAAVSTLTMTSLAFRDDNQLMLESDGLQEFHLVRSEIMRGQDAIANLGILDTQTQLPDRKVHVNHGYAVRNYVAKTRASKDVVQSQMNIAARSLIRTHLRAFSNRNNYINFSTYANRSMVERYAKKIIQKETFAGFMYLTNTDFSVNGDGDPVWFYGLDEVWGRVHSNSDIHIKNYSGWPIFHGYVTTAGSFVSNGGTIPYDDVFRGGYKEDYGTVVFSPTADLIRANGVDIWDEDPAIDIIRVKLNGTGYTSFIGTVINDAPTHMVLYNSYPGPGIVGGGTGPVIGDSIGTYTITLKDTIWTPSSSGTLVGHSTLIPADLWISGEVQGAQTWGCSGNMYLTDDITYVNTIPGQPADGILDESEGYQYPINTTDYLGLVSEKSILIQYGCFDPVDSLRKFTNCGSYITPGSTDRNLVCGIYIYGALCALGQNEDPHLDGVFSFEYQHPHISTQNVWFQSEFFHHVDLHLGKFPPDDPTRHWPYPAANAGGYAYPAIYQNWPDYPWYNPIWPERVNYMERGMIYLFGAVSQQRRGYVHRNPFDAMDQGHWNLTTEFMYGQTSIGVNAPETTGQGVGYNKRYHYDTRFVNYPPPDFPDVHVQGGETPYKGVALQFMCPSDDF